MTNPITLHEASRLAKAEFGEATEVCEEFRLHDFKTTGWSVTVSGAYYRGKTFSQAMAKARKREGG